MLAEGAGVGVQVFVPTQIQLLSFGRALRFRRSVVGELVYPSHKHIPALMHTGFIFPAAFLSSTTCVFCFCFFYSLSGEQTSQTGVP